MEEENGVLSTVATIVSIGSVLLTAALFVAGWIYQYEYYDQLIMTGLLSTALSYEDVLIVGLSVFVSIAKEIAAGAMIILKASAVIVAVIAAVILIISLGANLYTTLHTKIKRCMTFRPSKTIATFIDICTTIYNKTKQFMTCRLSKIIVTFVSLSVFLAVFIAMTDFISAAAKEQARKQYALDRGNNYARLPNVIVYRKPASDAGEKKRGPELTVFETHPCSKFLLHGENALYVIEVPPNSKSVAYHKVHMIPLGQIDHYVIQSAPSDACLLQMFGADANTSG